MLLEAFAIFLSCRNFYYTNAQESQVETILKAICHPHRLRLLSHIFELLGNRLDRDISPIRNRQSEKSVYLKIVFLFFTPLNFRYSSLVVFL